MNVFVSVDIEGISGVVHGDMMMPGQPEYDRGRKLMVGDANAAIEGAVQAGADRIVVADGHGPMRNIKIEDLHPAAHLVSGTADARDYCQLEAADSRPFDAALFVGYHAMAQTAKAIHPHTIAGAVVYELRVNGKPHGETGLNACVLGSLGTPVVLVTGDETTCSEARSFHGVGMENLAVKTGSGRKYALFRTPSATGPEIAAAAKRALEKRGSGNPYVLPEPVSLEVDFLTMAQCNRAGRTAGVEQTGPMTISVQGNGPWDQYRNLWAALRAALNEPASFLA